MQDNKKIKELKERVSNLMSADDSSTLWLLHMMSVALTATAENLIEYDQLVEITDRVDTIKDMQKGIDRDLSFEKTRKMLVGMIDNNKLIK
jgi:hypothetical protein|tara:strand:+ start:13610 stop:13882 length:273 start_codon:yes stop_codon:yes gene_type:complete